MNGPGVRDRLLRVAPLMLRLGVAAVLAVYGVQEVGGLFGGQADEHAVVDASGVDAWPADPVGHLGRAGRYRRLGEVGFARVRGRWGSRGPGGPGG